MTKQIIVKRIKREWFADFVGDNEIQRLFGTTMLPVACTPKAKLGDVVAILKKNNPDMEIVLLTANL